MTAEDLLRILARAFDEDGSRSGETPLDKLSRRGHFNQAERDSIIAALPEAVERIDSVSQWRALEILLGQLSLVSPAIGQRVERRIAMGKIPDAEARIWASLCALKFGAPLSDQAYDQLDQDQVVQANPREWFALIAKVSDPQAIVQQFLSLPHRAALNEDQASDLVRLLKRVAPSSALEPNGPLSSFFDALPLDVARAVAQKLKPNIGASFSEALALKSHDAQRGAKGASRDRAARAAAEAPPHGVFVIGPIGRDFYSSLVVFLVALPLCMGIAVASGVPAERGLITGVIGGIFVGALAGSPLQVSGPTAGLAAVVFEIVQQHGISMLGPLLILAGLIQLIAGAMKLGQWFRAISPAVVHGMLSGIGVLIMASQIHQLLGDSPSPNGLQNLMAIPAAYMGLSPSTLGAAETAFAVGLVTVIAMVGWEKFRPRSLKSVPGALVGILAGTLLAMVFGLDVQRIEVPHSVFAAITLPTVADFSRLAEAPMLLTGLALAFIASAETLLWASAVDRMHAGPRTRYNKELFAQGVGNMLCGVVGGLPITGGIVPSAANVQAGAATRLSTVLYGVWILALVALAPVLLRQLPSAALAGVLIVIGWRLISLQQAKHLFLRYGLLPTVIWAATFVTVVATDMLTGVMVGMGLTVLELLPHLTKRLNIFGGQTAGAAHELRLEGAATFRHLPRITKSLEAIPDGAEVTLDTRNLSVLDSTVSQVMAEWLASKRRAGTKINVLPGPFTDKLSPVR